LLHQPLIPIINKIRLTADPKSKSGKTILGGLALRASKLASPTKTIVRTRPIAATEGGRLFDWVKIRAVALSAVRDMTKADKRCPSR
jgi:hypothetical protein